MVSAVLEPAHGTKGGVGTETATVGTLTATAQATINLHFEDNPESASWRPEALHVRAV